MHRFLTENTTEMKLARTIVQGVCAVIVQALAYGEFEPKQLIAPAIIAVLTPLMAEMGKANEHTD